MSDNTDYPSESIPSVDAEPVPPRNDLESEQKVYSVEETVPKHTASVVTVCRSNKSHESNSLEASLCETQQSVERMEVSTTVTTAHSQYDATEENAAVRVELQPSNAPVQPLPLLAAVRPDDWHFRRFIVRLAKELEEKDLELLKERFSGIVVFQQMLDQDLHFIGVSRRPEKYF